MTTERITTAEGLVAARESRGLSTEDIQRQLKLHPRQVLAIESGDWASLPGLPFVRGTVRNYGRIVGVDVEPLLEAISGSTKAAELRSSSSLDEPLRPGGMMGFGNGGAGSRWIWALVVVAALIALVLFFGREADLSKIPSLFGGKESTSSTSGSSGDSSNKVESVAIAPSASSASPAGGASAAGGEATSVPIPQQLMPAPATPGGAETAGLSPPTALSAPTAPPAPTGPLLKMSFETDAWVEIRQRSDGKVISIGTQKANTTMEMPITVPVSVTLGNAEKIKLEFNGKPVGLRVQAGTGIARLTLP